MSERAYNVLVVDDEVDVPPLFRQQLRSDVRRGRYILHFAASGLEAVDCLDREPNIDLVLTDINMPGMDGLALLDYLADSGRDLRAVVMSAYGDMANIRAAMNRGAFDFLVKPVDFEDMKVTIERSLKNLEAWRDAGASRDALVSLNRELEIAWRIQNSVLPSSFPHHFDYDLYATLEPARLVSGDFYDVVRLDGDRLALVVGDVSGKGVPAAMLMMSVRTLVRGLVLGSGAPGEVLTQANDVLAHDNEMLTFVTMFLGVYDPESGLLSYATAGHPPPVFYGGGNGVYEGDGPRGVVLGAVPGWEYGSTSQELALGQGFLVYTDGVSEAQSVAGDFYGVERLSECLEALGSDGVDVSWLVCEVVGGVREFSAGLPQSDDITCLSLRRRGTGGADGPARQEAS